MHETGLSTVTLIVLPRYTPLIVTKDGIMQTLFLLPSHLIIAYSPNEGNLSFLWYITERQPYPLRWNNYTKCRRLISPKRKHFIAEGYSLIAFRSFSLLFTLKLSAKDIAYEASSLNGNEAKDFCLFVSLILFVCMFVCPFIYLFIYSLTHLFIYSFIH